jgi:hypothetical protein
MLANNKRINKAGKGKDVKGENNDNKTFRP